jgi:hypothetical protein
MRGQVKVGPTADASPEPDVLRVEICLARLRRFFPRARFRSQPLLPMVYAHSRVECPTQSSRARGLGSSMAT